MIVFDSLTGAQDTRTARVGRSAVSATRPDVTYADLIARGVYRTVCAVERVLFHTARPPEKRPSVPRP